MKFAATFSIVVGLFPRAPVLPGPLPAPTSKHLGDLSWEKPYEGPSTQVNLNQKFSRLSVGGGTVVEALGVVIEAVVAG